MDKLIITTQYFENYAIGPDGLEATPHWKPKGGVVFSVEVDAKDVFYSEEEHVVEAIEQLLKEMNNDYVRYEYLDHVIQFPLIELDSTKFSNLLNNITCNS